MFSSGLPVRNEAAQATRICCVTGAWQREGSVGRDGWHGSGTIPSWLSGVVCVPALSFAPETPRGDNRTRACYTANGDTSPIAIFLTGISPILQRSGVRGNVIQSNLNITQMYMLRLARTGSRKMATFQTLSSWL